MDYGSSTTTNHDPHRAANISRLVAGLGSEHSGILTLIKHHTIRQASNAAI